MSRRFTDLLGSLDLSPDPAECPGLVRADAQTLQDKQRAHAPLEEIVALERALHFQADYVYFRRFDGRPATATAYLYDWTERLAEAVRPPRGRSRTAPAALSDELTRLHKGVWSASEIPLVYVFLPTEVQIYHILQGPTEQGGEVRANPWQTIQLAGEIADSLAELRAFSARKLDDGRFWEEHDAARALRVDGAAFMALSQELRDCRAQLVDRHGLDDALVRKLLILFILIKYLEERTDRQGQGVIPPDAFGQFAPGARGFVDLLRAGALAVLAFLAHLASKERFNGDVFQLDGAEQHALRSAPLTPFAELLDARSEHGQRTFWRRYAFNELPVELISHLYEQFLPDQPGVVYTPPALVGFILDEVLPLSAQTPDAFRLIDPACGSGVFLVGAFKRIVQRWRRDHGFVSPDVATLKRLLRQHIFGVDCEEEAVRITLFSLSVALCDFLQPRVIWDELHFDCLLGQNLIAADFFAHKRDARWSPAGGFDLVVGNPPFKPQLTEAAAAEVAAIRQEEPAFDLPDRQLALLFLKSATRIAKPGAQIALVQPAGPFLYGESAARFRQPFLERVHVSQIVDFSHLSRVLFKRPQPRNQPRGGTTSNPGDVAVAVLFAENGPPTEEPLLHVTVRRTVQAEQKLLFEIDHYDLHFVSRAEARHNPFIWKSNFIGGGRISHLVRRLGQLPTLGAFLDRATAERGWDAGEGYIAGSPDKASRLEALFTLQQTGALNTEESDELKRLKKRYRAAPWLTGQTGLPTDAFTSDGLSQSSFYTISERFFAEPRRASLFQAPLLLVKEVIEAETGQLPVALLDTGVCFKHRIFGIHAPTEDRQALIRIRDHLQQPLIRFWVLATSPEYLINKSSAFRAADLLHLPLPDSPEPLDLSALEEALIDDALTHVAAFKREGDRAPVQQAATPEQLRQFADFFCRVLGSVYPTLRAADPVSLADGVCYPFYFGEAPSPPLPPGPDGALQLEHLLHAQLGSSLRCQRVLRVFSGNLLLLVKPPQLRYWLRSVAVRDADEIFGELQRQGF